MDSNAPYRLITSLLDKERFPALLLATEYHQRWSQLAIGGEGQASTTQIIHKAKQTTQTSLPLSPKPYLGEIENTIDELKTHLNGRKTPIRSLKQERSRPRNIWLAFGTLCRAVFNVHGRSNSRNLSVTLGVYWYSQSHSTGDS